MRCAGAAFSSNGSVPNTVRADMADLPFLNKEQRRILLRLMLESRQGDLREESLNRQGKGHFHVSGRGHEALAVIGLQLQAGDYVAPYYRDRGLCLGRGLTTRHLALEYFSKRDSASAGRMMPSHYSSRALNIVTVPTPTGSQLVPACGIAWGMQLDDQDTLVVTTVGDAATRQGDFYEAASFALERKLPLLLVVEDNAYGISTPTRKINPLALGVLDRGGWREVDGADAEQLHVETAKAIATIRAGGGPVFLWARMERLSSHTSSDDQALYRSKEDLAAIQRADPIRVLSERMIAAGELTAEEFKRLEAEIKEQVRRDYVAAEQAPDLSPATLLEEVTGALPAADEELFKPGRYRMGDLLNATLRAGLDADPARIIFGEDIEDPKGGVFRLTQRLSTDFPEQVFNSPLAESTIVGVGGGLALYGRRPVFEIQFIDFLYPGFNQLVANLANIRWRTRGEWKVPAVFYAPYGAYLPGGGLWHSQANESVFAHFPGLNIVIPSTPEDAAGLLWTAMHAEDITLFLLPKHLLWAEHETAEPVAAVPFGRARRVQAGDELTLVAWGNTMEKAREALAELKGAVSVELIDLRSIAPWDKAAIEESVRRTGRLVVVQEDGESCSVGQMIVTHLAGRPDIWAAMKAPPALVSKPDVMIGFNPVLEYAALPDVPRIVDAIRRTVARDPSRNGTVAGHPHADAPAPVAPVARATEPEPASGAIVVRVPIMGEGLRSARVVALNKRPGEAVQHDDALCELETDKAVYPVEASFAGTFREWKVKVDDTVLIGQELGVIDGLAEKAASAPVAAAKAAAGRSSVTGAVATGNVPDTTTSIPPAAALAARSIPSSTMHGHARSPALSPAITKRLGAVVPANILMDCRWAAIREARALTKVRDGAKAASPSAMIAWCAVRTMARHAGFRRLVAKDGSIREHDEFDLGVAVALEGDRLGTAAIAGASRLEWRDFVVAYEQAVTETRAGKLADVQAPLNFSSLGGFGIESATPIVVPPAMSTLFIGTAHERMHRDGGVVYPVEVVTLSLTFDHCVVNGAGAAAFVHDLKREIESFKLPA